MKYIINSVSPYVDGATPKISIDVSALDGDTVLISRPIVFECAEVERVMAGKNYSAALFALVEKMAQSDPALNYGALQKIAERKTAEAEALAIAQALADKINAGVLDEKPENVTDDTKTIEIAIKAEAAAAEEVTP